MSGAMWPADYASRSPPTCRPSAREKWQSLRPRPKARYTSRAPSAWHKATCHAVMPYDLAEVATTTSENIEVARERITSKALLHLQGQAAHPAPHVRMPRCDPYPNASGNWDHGLTDRSTADASPGDAPAGIRTIARANSTVMADPVPGTRSACTCTSAKLCAACSICRRHL